MSLLVRINIALVLIFLVGASAAGWVSNTILVENAKREAIDQARLMMESASAARSYTSTEIQPLLEGQLQSVFLAQSVLLDATLRATQANQFGLLGFGGDRKQGYSLEFEGSAAVLVTRNTALGAEVRTKPDNLRFAHEGTAFDVFAAYFLNKNLSATLAFVAMGPIARQDRQNGVYLSLQGGF